MDAFVFDVESRAGQLVDAGPVILAFVAHVKRFAERFFQTLSIERAHLLGDDDGNAFKVQGFLDGYSNRHNLFFFQALNIKVEFLVFFLTIT